MLPLRRQQHALRRAVAAPARPWLCANCARRSSTEAAQQPPVPEDAASAAATEPKSTPPKRTIFSGIQPTGIPHLGNYLGALKQWVKLQRKARDKDRLFFSIVDLHAITVKQDPALLSVQRMQMFTCLMALGLGAKLKDKPNKKSTIFYQSQNKQHAELMWLLSCSASMGYLGRMTQWKSKLSLPEDADPLANAPSNKEALKLGLFSYPVLQAADILLYNTTHVPVGEDQAQHIEFTRSLARGFNDAYGNGHSTLLKVPELILSPAKRVMSLTEPTKKMSKSDPNPASRILITDDKETIYKKFKAAKTDSIQGISYDKQARPGVSNLLSILYHMDESVAASPEDLAKDFENGSMLALKERVAAVVDAELAPIRNRYDELIDTKNLEIVDHANRGAEYATLRAKETIKRVKKAMGLAWPHA
ncbi:tryptophanyl-tRNA synthetase [Corynespora cassiicola Philippines]|uniref:tryptophan--tRNA ligase n=1 Tax=Corynespora cassiicola Philippines TaxID=1448308 RepID=A0A2T2P1L9_CORCC|nr:tryptophanyl-tRNA synthetase [Corynespora cassiicola Philippines]